VSREDIIAKSCAIDVLNLKVERNSMDWSRGQFYDNNSRLNIELLKEANNGLFVKIAELISRKFRIPINQKLEGLDQRYWDFQQDTIAFCLHQEHYLGISIYAQNEQSDYYVNKIADYLHNELSGYIMSNGRQNEKFIKIIVDYLKVFWKRRIKIFP
jgi:hypothetical protein